MFVPKVGSAALSDRFEKKFSVVREDVFSEDVAVCEELRGSVQSFTEAVIMEVASKLPIERAERIAKARPPHCGTPHREYQLSA